jgi:DNA-directed RNA polymerase specialized sigma24 family protein
MNQSVRRGRSSPLKITVTEAERQELLSLVRDPTEKNQLAQRARLILLSLEGHSLAEISRTTRMQRHTVRLWLERFLQRRLQGLQDLPRPGRPPGS